MAQLTWKRQAMLAAFLVAFSLIAYWLEFVYKPSAETKEEASKKPFPLKMKQIESIELWGGDGKHHYRFECQDLSKELCKPGDHSDWLISEPRKLRADKSNVNSLLSSLTNILAKEVVSLEEDSAEQRQTLLKQYGLDEETRSKPERPRVEIKTKSGESITTYLGETHPLGDGIFAGTSEGNKFNDERVLVLPTYFKSNLEHELTHWRNKKILEIATHEVSKFEYDGPSAKLIAERINGNWEVRPRKGKKGSSFAGDSENIDSLLTASTYLTAKGFAEDNKSSAKAKRLLRVSREIVTLTLHQKDEKQKPITLRIYERRVDENSSKLYATVSDLDPVFELEPGTQTRLTKSLKDLRLTRIITSLERFSVKRLEFSGKSMGPSPLILVQKDSSWQIAEGETGELDSEKVQNLLDRLSGKRIKDFLEGGAAPAGEKDGLKIALGEGEERKELIFWKSGEKLYARNLKTSRKEIFEIDPTVAESLPWNRETLMKAKK